MALVDQARRYVAVNDAGIELFQYPRDEVIGKLAGRTAVDGAPQDPEWEQLLRAGEFYGQHVVENAHGDLLQVSYAAHTTSVGGRWLALIVTLSAQLEPDGEELIVSASRDSEPARRPVSAKASVLTRRELEVVRHVALGASTRKIAADMFLSPATVRSHVRNAMVKTGAHTRAQLVAIVLGDSLGDE